MLARPPAVKRDVAEIRKDLLKKAQSMSRDELEVAYADLNIIVEGLDRVAVMKMERQRDIKRRHAAKAASVRHREGRERKEDVIKAYLQGDVPAKDKAASILAEKFGVEFGTARKYLININHPRRGAT